MSAFTVRPTGSEKAPFRVNLTAATLLSLKLRAGDLCILQIPGEDGPLRRTAIAWENSTTGMKDNIIQTTKFLQQFYGLKLGDKVTIQRSEQRLEDAERVVLQSSNPLSQSEQIIWSFNAAAIARVQYDVLAPSQSVLLEVGDQKQEFLVAGDTSDGALLRVTKDTIFTFESKQQVTNMSKFKFEPRLVGGLQNQIRQIQGFVLDFMDKRKWGVISDQVRYHGLLLYGPKGTGKSLLLNQLELASEGQYRVSRWTPGMKLQDSTGLTLVLVEMDSADKDKLLSGMLSLFATIADSDIIVIGATRHPSSVPETLRNAKMFAVEIELPVPTAAQRLDILKALRGCPQPSDQVMENLSKRTHGYVGADLRRLLVQIWQDAFARHDREREASSTDIAAEDEEDRPVICDADVEPALQSIRPSALDEIFLDTPNVRWTDIGGQAHIKKQLQSAVNGLLRDPTELKALGLKATKGVLLYGPPGCSKTMTVKALATETDLNFLAVKGAELLSMYVGESERATREVFRKAKQASPCIIFIDEIDAIASKTSGAGGNVQVLTTLLNEIDGFEELRNVLVVAATNKPEALDPALIRPGRFDKVFYVGPPDLETRQDIFAKHFASVSVESDFTAKLSEFAAQTEGHSGAEITEICQTAGQTALDSDRLFVTVEDVLQAITNTSRGISKNMLFTYESWNAARRRK